MASPICITSQFCNLWRPMTVRLAHFPCWGLPSVSCARQLHTKAVATVISRTLFSFRSPTSFLLDFQTNPVLSSQGSRKDGREQISVPYFGSRASDRLHGWHGELGTVGRTKCISPPFVPRAPSLSVQIDVCCQKSHASISTIVLLIMFTIQAAGWESTHGGLCMECSKRASAV